MSQNLGLSQPVTYQICIEGYLEDRWAGWFEGMTLEREDAQHMTILTGMVPDQPALHGLLARIRDLGLPLLSVTRVAAEGETEAETTRQKNSRP